MLFNSIEFLLFLPVVFGIYWMLGSRGLKTQNFFLLAASYFFYGWWDWRFLTLIVFSSVLDYSIGLKMSASQSTGQRKLLLLLSVAVNLGFLGFFKYFDFFLLNLNEAFTFLGNPISFRGLEIVLPVGISFYTFQTLSYTIDIYRKKIAPSSDPIAFFSFVSFFPQLVAGPIERASNLLPQFSKPRKFNRAKAEDGMRQMLWGLFKKVVIADNCAPIVDSVYADVGAAEPFMLVVAIVLFSFQIYCDFSGYSDIAIGCARLFGFNLMQNFAFPYFSRDIAEFWRRWHISLSTWFRDYLYIPLGGSRGGKWMKVRNTMIIFIVSGFWHGANWTFIFWGALNALFFLPLLLGNRNRSNLDTIAHNKFLPGLNELGGVLLTFALTNLAWIFFRAASIEQAFEIIGRLGDLAQCDLTQQTSLFKSFFAMNKHVVLIFFLLAMEWWNRQRQHGLEMTGRPTWLRRGLYIVMMLIVFTFGNFQEQSFIYFQF